MSRRVVITGLGPVSSIGTGVTAFGRALRAGTSGISAISSFDSSGFPHYMAGEVPDFDPKALLRTLSTAEWGRTSLFAAAAARLAVADAGIDEKVLAGAAAGSSIGTTSGESQVIEALTAEWVHTGLAEVTPAYAAQVPASRLATAVNQELGLTGEAVTLSTACSASNYALGYAYDQIVTGDADYMIAGGADSVCRWAHAGFYRLGALTEKVCSPFDKDRSGILTGEGGAALFLETLESATGRGAHIYAEVLGYGLNCDANHMVAPDPVSIAECMRRAHHNAGIAPGDVDYICAHGTGTPANDAMEAQAVVEVFGTRPPPISSIKSMLGHTMGAASGFGAIAAALAIDTGFLPPTTNYRTPDPALPAIDPVPNESRPARPEVVQNNGFAFGGNNAITILGRVA
ncbi:beta-ketoacyl-[acyl-carrier-protein] synthase family protein [Streptomyces malaysiensis subsp. malaysiensis]|uniref:Beta-ketoacyl-[acyl-carrier-protein] synthase family protein n=1 Tax=Streptomyces malaysiensis TaxID=92644 RepID=A0ABX6WHV3_STRMQ|nr:MULTISPECIES: beta-ketoacyl-[acyl-carrier-protein] synthase family protein [Streptomyces]QPI61000.1 beta-ketoacyl-[acyl-carrier-protein] synthase family protein [Streptomyces solisilvae]UHH22750.1 beta-ketoacyl-[acyl-carrier-protein] synthase family protein [Streptomyces sp. HNM0561]